MSDAQCSNPSNVDTVKGYQMSNFDLFIDAVRHNIQPANRVEHLIGTLQQLFTLIPADVTLGDVITGWQALASPQSQNEEASVVHRRHICRELSAVGKQYMDKPGSLNNAVKAWQAWQDAFQSSTDPRQAAMAKILQRELGELHAIA
jgi:hypothetical protein